MRTTLRIDDELLRELKLLANKENVPLTVLANRLIRRGLEASHDQVGRARRRYRERTFSMGTPRGSLDKALALAAALEDEEVVEKLAT